jgi:hypothetical protein
MNALKLADIKHVVAIDIETVRLAENFSDLPEAYQDAWSYKNKQDGEIPEISELEDLWTRTSSLYAEFSKICAVSIAFLDKTGQRLVCKGFAGEDEHQLLCDLGNFLEKIKSGSPQYRLAGHASNWFDFPFMAKRYIINRLEIPTILDDTDKKPWECINIDTNNLWKMGKTGPGSSLQALCVALEVPVSKVDMVGDEVGKEFFKGNIEGIRDYCNKDAIATFNVIRRMKLQDIFEFDQVVYLGDVKSEEEESEVIGGGVLHNLFTNKEFNESIQQEIRAKFEGKKVLKKEWLMLQDMLTSLYVNNEMFKSDSDDVKAKKAEEVAEFVNQLKEEHNA